MNPVLLSLWRAWDNIYQAITRLEYVDKKNGNLFRVVFCKYRGSSLVTRDGVVLQRGDLFVKLHIHNWLLTKELSGVANEAKLGIKTLRLVQKSLPGLAEYLAMHPKSQQVKVIVGTSFLHRGVKKLGFDVFPVPNNWVFRWKRFYLKILLSLLHPQGRQRLHKNPAELTIKRIYISCKHLRTRYSYYEELLETKG